MNLLPFELHIAVGLLIFLTNGLAEIDPSQWPERIVGGLDVPSGHYVPYQVSLQLLIGSLESSKQERVYQHYCGGSIISMNHILTAAHCCQGFNPRRMSIVAGVRDLNDPPIRVAVDSYSIHPNYVELTSSDIAIIQLSSPLPLDNITMAVIDINRDEYVPDGTQVVLSGWGLRVPYHIQFSFLWSFLQNQLDAISLPKVLQIRSFKIISDSECKFVIEQLTETEICAKGEFISGACSGDSGGPLVMLTPNGLQQVGLVSYGLFVCGVFNTLVPDVYTKISKFSSWIEKNMHDL